ncbi:hypothetical protein AALP_AA5G065900 [Arabis alpina]|uniref:Uncharacterized protein n=1 Tax=Arabis alpina TaxID=50452 RepID=A0A087GVD1_ARAAL|nr:hypothetical protein AALP_AA5G065900 [Arabis alpina]
MNPMFYFFLALTTVLTATADNAIPVVDANGDNIFNGSYYIFPIDAEGGGVTLSGLGDKPCPLELVQDSSNAELGFPVKFSNWKSNVGFVPESESLNIEMDITATICDQSTYWWVDKRHKEGQMRFVTAGPKPEVFHFQIEKSEDFYSYKFVVCPNWTQSRDECKDVGIFVDENGVRRFALGTNLSFSFLLMKVIVAEDSSKTMSM